MQFYKSVHSAVTSLLFKRSSPRTKEGNHIQAPKIVFFTVLAGMTAIASLDTGKAEAVSFNISQLTNNSRHWWACGNARSPIADS